MPAMLDATDSQMAMLGDLVTTLEAIEATVSGMQAARDGLLALAARLAIDIAQQGRHPDQGDMALRAVAAEIGAAQRVSDRTIERRMTEASWLVEEFPSVWAAQGAGRITAAHSRVIVDAGAHLDDAADRASYAAAAIEVAATESPNRLRRSARRIAESFQARSLTDRHRDAREKRRIWVKDLDDGMSELGAYGPSALLHGMYDRLSQMAHQVSEENARACKDSAVEACTPLSTSGTDRGTGTGSEGEAEAMVAADPECARGVDQRTIDQLRADLLADVVLTGVPSGHDDASGSLAAIHARIEVTVPVLTLMGGSLETALDAASRRSPTTGGRASPPSAGTPHTHAGTSHAHAGTSPPDAESSPPVSAGSSPIGAEFPWPAGADTPPPAELDGACPIDPETARRLAGAATGWERVLTHPISGALLAVDRYRPSEQLRRHLRARDQRCRFPACGLAARRCDIDHNHAASDGGSTCDENLAHFCRRHHMLKHHSPWQVRQTAGGSIEWQSPAGQVYVDRPPVQNTVTFSPEHEGGGGDGR